MTDVVKKRILIIGSGASGSACAWLLGKHKDKFDVEIWEKTNVPGKGCCSHFKKRFVLYLMMNFFKGGVATSFNVDKYGTFINDGVQGGSYSYRNTLLLHKVIMILRLFKYEYLMIRLLEVGFNINGLKFKT